MPLRKMTFASPWRMIAAMEENQPKSLMQDLSCGFSGKCLHCGEGKLFAKWLKVADHCTMCGEEFHHHKADDFPAYIVIFILDFRFFDRLGLF